MPRKRYPSDHRRWFRVMEDVLDDPKLAEVPEADCWLWLQLLAVLNRQKSRNGQAEIPIRSLCALARRQHFGHVEPRLSRLRDVGLLAWSVHGATFSYSIHKWPKIQGFAPTELRHDSDETPATTPTPNPIPINPQTPLPAEPAAIPGGNSSAAKKRAPPIPERWTDAVARLNAVFRLYDGPMIRRVGPPRGKRFAVIDRDYGPLAEIGSKAIHGYVCRHGTKDHDDFAARKYFELDSILAPSHLDANLQACEDAIERGHSKPFRRGDHTRNAKAREPPESPAAVARQVSESLKQARKA